MDWSVLERLYFQLRFWESSTYIKVIVEAVKMSWLSKGKTEAYIKSFEEYLDSRKKKTVLENK